MSVIIICAYFLYYYYFVLAKLYTMAKADNKPLQAAQASHVTMAKADNKPLQAAQTSHVTMAKADNKPLQAARASHVKRLLNAMTLLTITNNIMMINTVNYISSNFFCRFPGRKAGNDYPSFIVNVVDVQIAKRSCQWFVCVLRSNYYLRKTSSRQV